ncbi:hypothetical protein ACLMJK_004079 [Lecanora helva]
MGSRKRGRDEMEVSEPATEQSLLERIRNTWELANIMQYIFIFGKAVKIDEDLTIEDLENECVKPESSQVLSDIGLALLKYVSSHRGLNHEIFDEYTRRQYLAKAPAKNPFGDDETPNKFTEFDVFTKLKVLVQLSQWTLINADRMRQNMSDATDSEQLQWRIEEIGYDKDGCYYFVLDDNRLYRRTDPPPPPPHAPKPKANSKKGKAAARASKRRRTNEIKNGIDEVDGEIPAVEGDDVAPEKTDDGFGGRKWECIAVSLGDYQDFLESIKKSRDADERALHKVIMNDVLPVIEKAEESLLRKRQKQEREMLNIQKLATAKRSSRLEAKMERERQEQEAAEAERKKKAALLAAKQDQERQKNMEDARESRIMTREQRIKDRENKRILHEEELANLSEENKKVEAGEARLSERHLKTEMEKKKKELAALAEYDEWFFDCSKCGVHGTNLDDGTHSVACEKCNVWQHSACLGISQEAAEKDDFHFVCHDCKRREEDAKKPKIPSLKFHVGSSTSPPSQKPQVLVPGANEGRKRKSGDGDPHLPPMKKFKLFNKPQAPNPSLSHSEQNGHHNQNAMRATVMNGPALSPQGQLQPPGLQSAPGPQSHTNGYTNHVNGNGYVPQLPPAAFQSPCANSGSPSHDPQTQNVGWSARYTPPQQSQYQHAHGPPPPALNPFANTFDRQRPSSSHSTNNVASPVKSKTAFSPPQQNAAAFTPAPYQNPQTNGLSPHNPLPPTGPPAYSPVKQQSPPVPPIRHPSSSPVTHQPPLKANGPSSPGFSPTKHSPPRHGPPGHGINGTPAVLPPAPQLSPSPPRHAPDVAMAGMTPSQPRTINGETK